MKKQVLSMLLAAGMLSSYVAVPGMVQAKAASPEDSLVANYQFNGNWQDSVHPGTVGTGEGSSQPTLVTDDTRGEVMKSGSGKSWVKTDNPLYGEDLSGGFTVSAWIDANAVDTWLGIWSFSSGTGNADGFYGMSSNGSIYFNDNPGAATYQDMKEFGGTVTKDGGWEHVTVVMDNQQIRMYKDGALVKELTPSTQGVNPGKGTDYMLDFVSTTQFIYLGTASPHYWNSGDFKMDDFKVYSKALSEDEVRTEYLSDETEAAAIVAGDKAALTVADMASMDLTLPTVGSSGYTTISWASSNPAVIATDGTVVRPEEDTQVTLTATISLGQVSDTKEFTVTVPKQNPNGDLAIYRDQLTLGAGYIAGDLELPDSIGAASITWTSSDEEFITSEGNVTRPQNGNAAVTLTATLSLDGADDVTKDIKLVVLEQGADIASYVSNDPDLSTDGLRGQTGGMKVAQEEADGTFTALHKDQPIMYTTLGAKAYVSPVLLRKADGDRFAMIAGDGGNNSTILVYDSDDLIDYTNERTVSLPGVSSIAKLACVYDLTAEEYLLYVGDKAGTVYQYTSKDLSVFEKIESTNYTFSSLSGVPSDAVWATSIPLTQAEYDKLTAKYSNPYNTSITPVTQEVTVEENGDAQQALDEAVGELIAQYSNGEERTYDVRWNTSDLDKVDTSRPGVEYTIRGTIGGSAYYTDAQDPLIEERADPSITYDEERDLYYFTASYPVNGKDGADGYDRLVIRVADTIEGLADAQEYVIWDESESQGFGQFIWAPELHKIGDSWYFLSTAARVESGYSFDLRPFLLKCNNADDITNPDSWGEPQRINLKAGDTTALNAMSLDMTYFEVGDKAYYAWADFTRNADNPNGVSSIYIASVDPANPTQLTSNCSVISVPEYYWELQRYTVNEGPSVLQNNGKVYMAFSASGTGAEYCIGLLTADATSDLLDPDSWTKTPYPIMTSGDFNDELCGPGHNSFTVDEDGNPVIVYHARNAAEHANHSGDPLYDACRHAYVKPVFFDSEGVPVLNMSDDEFVKGGSEITVTLKVAGEAQEAQPVLEYNFDEDCNGETAKDSVGDNDANLEGGAVYAQDPDYGQVLYLDGDSSDGWGGHDSYLAFPEGFFDGMDSVTISMDVKEVTRWGNFFTFTIGQDNQKYLFLKTMPTNLKLAITTGSYSTEQIASWSGAYPDNSRTWINLKLVVTRDSISIYRDGELVAEKQNTGISISDLGDNLKAYLGKSFYGEDLYFRGYFDNVKVFDYAMSEWEVKTSYQQDEADRLAMLEDVQRVAETFTIPNADDIRGNITLPQEQDGVSITWTSSNEDVISTAVVEHENYDATPAGVVTRGEEDQTVTLTAVFSKEGQTSVTKTYDVVVKAKAEAVTEDDYVGYLFVHFTGNEAAASHEQTYFSISEDGLNWTDLNNNQAVLTSNIGESGLRDHFIARAPEGDKYYMIATDLSIYHNGGNWPGAGGSGSHGIVVWESTDLVNWSEPWIAEIAPENAGCTWAPEFIYDDTTGEYVVYWSATSIELDEEGNIAQEYENHAIYYSKTRDFRTFTDPVLYHAGGTDANGKRIKVIDSTMIENDGKYYRYTKNESRGIIEIDVADSVLGTFTPIESVDLSTNLPAAQGAVEGPIIFKLNEKSAEGEDQWCLMVDRFARGQGYYPLITTDLSSGEFTMLDDSQYSMPSKYRHGYVMPLTAKEYDALQRAYGSEDYVSTYLLEQTLEAAKGIDMDALTQDSAQALTQAIAAAEEALATVQTTQEADAAAQALQEVMDNLTYQEDVVLESIQVTAPNKTEYTQGEELDLTGMTVTATYGNGTTQDVTAQASVTGYDKDQVGAQTITVTYTEDTITVTDTFVVTVTEVEQPSNVDKTLLEKTIAYAETLSTDGVTDSAVAAFQKALTEAKAVMADTEATQEQVNTAWDNLLEGIWGLGLVQGDKTLLEQLITKADGMMAEADKYVETNWKQLVDALSAAKDVAADGDAMDEDIQPVAEALLNAILAQRFKADKSILEGLIGQAEGMDLTGYTAESVAAFRTALATAQAVMADATLSEDDQKTVDEAVAALTAAMNGLTAQGETQPSDQPETTDQPQTTQKPDAEGGSVQTGDQANVVLPAAVALLALVGLMFVVSFGTKKRG